MNVAACTRDYCEAGKAKEDLLSLMHAQVEDIYDQNTTDKEELEDDDGKKKTPVKPGKRMSGRKNLTGKYSSKKGMRKVYRAIVC